MDIKLFITTLEQNSIAYKQLSPHHFRVETLHGSFDCWPTTNKRRLIGLDISATTDLESWLATLRQLPVGNYVFIVYHTSEDIEFYKIPEQVVEPYKDKLIASQGYIVNVDLHSEIAGQFISVYFHTSLRNLWQCYRIPQTEPITSANISTVYNFGFYF
jgi:hypothetical protein